MIESLTIEHLRGIVSANLTDFVAVNVLIGPNSSGKSTILDALLIGAHPDPKVALTRMPERRPGLVDPQRWLLWREGDSEAEMCQIKLRVKGSTRSIELRRVGGPRPGGRENAPIGAFAPGGVNLKPSKIDPSPIPEIRLVLPESIGGQEALITDLFSDVVNRALLDEAREIIVDLDPSISDILILKEKGQAVLSVRRKTGTQPIDVAGDGVRFLIRLSLELAARKGTVILLEEPETHLHPAAIRQCARAMLAASRRGNQLFAATHSLDLIDSLLANCEDLDSLAFYRTNLVGGQLRYTRIAGNDAATSRAEFEKDLR